jgi:hypothetical protein
MMIVTLDTLANRYNCLPSEALARATTLDLQVLDISTRFMQRQRDIADGKLPAAPELSQEEMMAMLAEVRK